MMSKQSKFLEPLAAQVASGNSIKQAAEIVGCSLQSAYNLSHTEHFRFRVSEIRSEITQQAIGKLTDAASLACDTLRELLDVSQRPSDRLNAAKSILANLGPLSELAELRARLDRLEQTSALKVVS
jgi:hypothetical protein